LVTYSTQYIGNTCFVNGSNYQFLSNLQRLQDTLRGEWEGQAFQGFDAQFNELKPKVQNFAELMQQINVQLDKTAQAMQQHDQDLSRNFGLQ